MIDAGDEGACFFDNAKLEPVVVRSNLATSATLTGWGGSGREGKVSRKPDRQHQRQVLDLPRMDWGKMRRQFPVCGGRLIQTAQ